MVAKGYILGSWNVVHSGKQKLALANGVANNDSLGLGVLLPVSWDKEPNFFFLLRTALKDRPQRPPTANRQPPTASGNQPPTANHCQPPPITNHRPPPTANRQPPTANI